TPFAVIVGDILQNRRTGELTILRSQTRKTLYWSQGELVLIASSNPDESLAHYLTQRGAIPIDKAMQIGAAEPTGAVSRFHEPGRDARMSLDTIPLNDAERQIAQSLRGPQSIEAFLKSSGADTVSAARVVIAMLALGVFAFVDYTRQQQQMSDSDMQRDLELL